MKVLIASIITLLPVASYSQEADRKYFMTRQECEPAINMIEVIKKYGEKPLFSGTGMQFDYQGRPFTGGSMFFVNQDTGTWSLLTLYADGTACTTAVGTEFQPYVGD
jgi:hypothetical protein